MVIYCSKNASVTILSYTMKLRAHHVVRITFLNLDAVFWKPVQKYMHADIFTRRLKTDDIYVVLISVIVLLFNQREICGSFFTLQQPAPLCRFFRLNGLWIAGPERKGGSKQIQRHLKCKVTFSRFCVRFYVYMNVLFHCNISQVSLLLNFYLSLNSNWLLWQ